MSMSVSNALQTTNNLRVDTSMILEESMAALLQSDVLHSVLSVRLPCMTITQHKR